jgi:hypothetical protein
MKIGDLVSLKMKKTQPPQIPRHGVIVNMWRNHKNRLQQIEILWSEGNIAKFNSDLFEVINENR